VKCWKCGNDLTTGDMGLTCQRCSNLNRAQSTASNTEDTRYQCTVCGRIGSVGRCCGIETRIAINDAARAEQRAPRQYGPYPHACKVLAQKAEELLHSMRITLETPAEQMVRAANERHVALELAAGERALMYADERLAALIELIKAAKANDSGGNDDRHVWMRRAIKEAEGLV